MSKGSTITAAVALGAALLAVPAIAVSVGAVRVGGLTGDPAHGGVVFHQCQTCHVITAGQNRIGPSLHAVVGRRSGMIANFAYSAANKKSGVVWTEPVLFKYLENPRGFMPGTTMSFVGLKKPQDRADVIAYLKTAAK